LLGPKVIGSWFPDEIEIQGFSDVDIIEVFKTLRYLAPCIRWVKQPCLPIEA
jgi:hypothetical protein